MNPEAALSLLDGALILLRLFAVVLVAGGLYGVYLWVHGTKWKG